MFFLGRCRYREVSKSRHHKLGKADANFDTYMYPMWPWGLCVHYIRASTLKAASGLRGKVI